MESNDLDLRKLVQIVDVLALRERGVELGNVSRYKNGQMVTDDLLSTGKAVHTLDLANTPRSCRPNTVRLPSLLLICVGNQ